MTEFGAVNGLERAAFLARFGHVFEHSPWVMEGAWDRRPFADQAALLSAMAASVEAASEDAQLALLRAHPDLAGKAARAGDLTEDSRKEQAGAGLDRLSEEEFTRFHAMNEAYKARFGFPFIVAVKGLTKGDILAAYAARLENSRAAELETALAQVLRIAGFRVADALAALGIGKAA